MLDSFKNSFRDISKMCFQNCVNIQNKHYEYEEE